MAMTRKRSRVARAAVAAALSGAMALGGVLGPVGMALAADSATVSIKKSDGTVNIVTDYKKAILIFSADNINNAQNDDGGLATGVNWSTVTDVKTKVMEFLQKGIDETGASQTYLSWLVDNHVLTGDNAVATSYAEVNIEGVAGTETNNKIWDAKFVADYIGEEIAKANSVGTSFQTDTTNPNVPKITHGSSFANKLAAALADLTATKTFPEDTGAVTLEQTGYYILMGDSANDPTPIWLPFDVDDGPVGIYEKAQVPEFSKTAVEGDGSDTSAEFEKIIDAGNGDKVTFTLEAKLAQKDSYSQVVFEDILPVKGLMFRPSADSIKVYIDNVDNTAQFGFSGLENVTDPDDDTKVTGQRFTVYYNNGSGTKPVAYTGAAFDDVVIRVEYTVEVDENATTGANELNTNRAKFHYGDGQEISTESESSVASYQIKIVKIDSTEGTALSGAVFTLQLQDDEGEYFSEDGSHAAAQASLNVAADGEAKGTVTVKPVDADKYYITETTAPAGYEPIDPFTVTVSPSYDEVTGKINSIEVTALSADGSATSASVDATVADGIVTVTVPNGEQEIRLPITGMTPSQLGTIAGLVLVAAGALIIVRRRQAERA